MRSWTLLILLFVAGALCHNTGYHRLRVVNGMYNSGSLRIDILQEGDVVKSFNLAYKEYSDAFWLVYGQYSIETYKGNTNILLANAFIATTNYNALIMLAGDYPNAPFTALVEDVSVLPSTGATLRAIHALSNTTLDLTFDSSTKNITNNDKIQAKEWATTTGTKTLQVRRASTTIGSAQVELSQDMPRTVIVMGRLNEQIDIIALPPVDFSVEARVNIINLKSEPITVTDTLDGSTLDTVMFNASSQSGYFGVLAGYRSFFVVYSSVDSVVMFLEGFVEYTLIFTDDKEPVIFVDSIPQLNQGEAMLTFALVGAASPKVFNVTHNGVNYGPWSTNDIAPHFLQAACCGSVSLMVGQKNIQFSTYQEIRDKVTRVIIVNDSAVVLQKLATSCGQIRFRVVNALFYGPTAIRIALEGADTPALADQLEYGAITEYNVSSSTAGLYRLVVSDQDGNYLFSSCARLNGATDHTFVAVGDDIASFKVWTLEDDNTQPAYSKARVRAVFAIPDITDQNQIGLKATTTGDRFLFPAVNFQSVTAYLEVLAGNYSVRLLYDSQVLGTTHKPVIPAGSVVSLFVLGSAKDQVFQILVQTDAQYVDEAPVVPVEAAPIQVDVPLAAPKSPFPPVAANTPLTKKRDSAAVGLSAQALFGLIFAVVFAF